MIRLSRQSALYGATVFLGGAVGMVLELVGSRLLAPYFGNSLFVWTALIGIMLGFMSLGNYLGGRLADKTMRDKEGLDASLIYWILIGASLGIALVSFIDSRALPALTALGSIRWGAVLGATALFAIPCTLLGMVSPICIRFVMSRIESSGSKVGSFYALATLGSIAGTFAGGFWLIAAIGSTHLIGWLALVPLLLAFFYLPRRRWQAWVVVLLCALMILFTLVSKPADTGQFDTSYDWYYIGETKGLVASTEADAKRTVRYLARDYVSAESAVYVDNGDPVVFPYYRYYDLALGQASKGDRSWTGRTLMIGGGIFSYPRHQLALYPSSSIDAVEIDPQLKEVAQSDFFLKDDPRLRIFLEDGRMFLNRGQGSYDVVILDAFKSANSIPFQLTTVQSMQRCSDVLSDDGVLVMNIIANALGPGSRYVSAQYQALKQVFPQVELYYVAGSESGATGAQNISIICSKKAGADFAAQLREQDPDLTSRTIDPTTLRSDVPALTDDFAPVDQYLIDLRS